MAVVCWELGCNHNNMKNTCSFFRFPNNEEKRRQWLLNLTRNEEPSLWACLCSCHFLDGKKENGPRKSQTNETIHRKANIEIVLCPQSVIEAPEINTDSDPLAQVLKTSTNFYKCAETLPNYQCDNCTYNTPWKVSLINHHYKECHNKKNKIFKCPNCSFETHWELSLKCHLRNHSNKSTRLFCDYCPYKCKYRENLVIHKKKHEVKFLDKKPRDKRFKFNIKFVENVKYYECVYCFYQTRYTSNLYVHIIHKHNSDKEIESSYSWQHQFKCQRDKQTLNFHSRASHGIKATTWYNCDQCDFKTTIINKLKVHKSSHHETVKKFKCLHCPFTTQRIGYLQEHNLLKHTPDDEAIWYQCGKCNFKSRLSRILNRHKAIHDPDDYEKYECHNCAYKTCDKQSLKSHMIYKHTPDEAINWLHCDQCAFKAKFASDLKKHKLRHC